MLAREYSPLALVHLLIGKKLPVISVNLYAHQITNSIKCTIKSATAYSKNRSPYCGFQWIYKRNVI